MSWNRRRAEIAEDFEREIYGRVPKDTPQVTWSVVSNVTVGNTALLEGELAWRQHDGGHDDCSNMKSFLAWAQRLLPK